MVLCHQRQQYDFGYETKIVIIFLFYPNSMESVKNNSLFSLNAGWSSG